MRASSRPQLALTGGYMYLENQFLTDDEFLMAGIGFQWNVFDGGQSRKRSAAIDRKAAAVGHNRADLASMIDLQVRRAWNDRVEAESRLRVAESAVSQATENLRVVRNRYEAGASTNVEVLDGEALREQALSNRDTARFEVEPTPVAPFKQETGHPPSRPGRPARHLLLQRAAPRRHPGIAQPAVEAHPPGAPRVGLAVGIDPPIGGGRRGGRAARPLHARLHHQRPRAQDAIVAGPRSQVALRALQVPA